MPIYEYRCQDCRWKVSIFVKRIGGDQGIACPRCGGARLERLFSRFALARSEDERLERLAETSALGDVDENDPKSLARFMKRMGRELGDEAGEDFDQLAEEADAEAERPAEGNETSTDA
jgi:putative FmdB family regulatory protein